MTYIERLQHDIAKCDEAIEFCIEVGDAPEDYKDLTDERKVLVDSLIAAVDEQTRTNPPKLFSAVKLEDLVVQFDALGWSYGPSLGSLRIACSEQQALWLTKAIQRAVTFCGMPANLRNV